MKGRVLSVNEITSQTGTIDPIFVSVKDAAKALGISTWAMYQLLDDEDDPVESRYKGARRLVVVESLRNYASNLPTERPKKKDAS